MYVYQESRLHLITTYSRIVLFGPQSARSIIEVGEPGGQPCEPNRAAAAPLRLKVLGFVNTKTLYVITDLITKE
jgi:hypothetical protein